MTQAHRPMTHGRGVALGVGLCIFFFFFFWSEQVTRAESSNPVPPLKRSDKRAVQPDRHHPARCSSAITSPHGHVGDAFGATC